MKKSRVFWGLLFIAGAILILISPTGILGDLNILSLFISFILLYCLGKGIVYRSPSGIIFPIALLCIQYDDFLGIDFIGPWTILLAAALLSIGFSFLFPKKRYCPYKYKDQEEYYKYENKQEYDDSDMRFQTSFKESIHYINSTQFEYADVQCSFGSSKIFLDNATLKNDCAYINIEGSFCGIELFVPKDWCVENHVEFVFGGSEETYHCENTTTSKLILQGKIVFGGLTITYI